MDKSKNIAVGIDIESIERFEFLQNKDNFHFLEKVFTEDEINYCYAKRNPAQQFAQKFTGKEAVIKAFLSVGMSAPRYASIEISGNSRSPKVHIRTPRLKNSRIKMSVSSSRTHAVALAILDSTFADRSGKRLR